MMRPTSLHIHAPAAAAAPAHAPPGSPWARLWTRIRIRANGCLAAPRPAELTAPPAPPVEARGCVHPYVRSTGTIRSLHFNAACVQSRMDTRRPASLELEYLRTMMGFLLFAPDPAHIGLIGLGGGSLTKFCDRHLPESHVTAVEINPAVIALRDTFQVPRDCHRFKVVEADGAAYLRRTAARFCVLLVDGYDQFGLSPSLVTPQFFESCRRALNPRGVLVMNLMGYAPDYPMLLARIRAVFGATAFAVHHRLRGNSVVFAFRDNAQRFAGALRLQPPRTLDADGWAHLRAACLRVHRAARAALT